MDMQNLLNKLNGLLAEETSNPEPEQLSLGLHQMVDMSGEPCIRCKKGHYTETSISDDWDGVNHCSKCNHRITRHLTTDELNKLKKSVSESDEAGPIKQCVSCGDKAHVDYITGMCVDCQTKAEEEQGLSESPMGRRAPDEPHTCETCGRPMPNWEPGDGAECDECAEGMSPEDSDPDELDEASATKHALYGQMKKTSNPSNYKPEISNEPIDTDDYDTDHFEVDDNVSCWGCGQDWKENWSAEDLGPGEGYEEYGLDADDKICPDCAEELTGGELNEAAMCEVCGEQPCVCETDQLEEAKVKNYYAVATAAIKKKYDLGPGKVDLTDAQTAEAHKLAKKLKKDDQKLKESEQDGAAELGQLKRMMECWGPMAAPQASGMNVTTNVDSKTGNKTVTVTADGEGAEDLMQILAMAGIAITPAPVAATPVGEQVANEPAPQTLDAQTQLVDMAGGPNAPHAQYNPDRARDNSMAIVDEAVDRLASKLRAKFQNQ